MNKLNSILLAVMALTILAFQAKSDERSQLGGFIFSDYLQDAYKNYDAFLLKKRGEVEFESGAKPANCAEYLEALKTSEVRYGQYHRTMSCQFSGCVPAEIIKKGQPHAGYSPKSYSEELKNRFDFQSFRNSFRKRMEIDHKIRTMADLKSPFVKVVNPYMLVFEDADWYEQIELEADADLNGNGKPDWLISVVEKAIGGTLFDCSVLIVYDVEPTGLLTASEVPRQ